MRLPGKVASSAVISEVSLVASLASSEPGSSDSVGVVALGQPVSQLEGVGQVAVVAQGDAAGRGRAEGRLGVLPDARAGGRVAAVADRQVARAASSGVDSSKTWETRPMSLKTMICDALADRDAGGLLAAVLQRVEAEVGELGHLLAGGPDTEDTAGVLGSAVVGVEVVVQPTVCSWHCLMVARQTPETRPHRAAGRRTLLDVRNASPCRSARGGYALTESGSWSRRRPDLG